MKPSLPVLMSFGGGYVDTAGFLALQGLFTAHVTGNFVTFGASLVLGTSGAVAKLMALPVFCIVVFSVRLLDHFLKERGTKSLRVMLTIKCLLFGIAAVLAVRYGPFHDAGTWQAVLTGMVLVSAMAIQNAIHRVHLGASPPTTLMTGTTTQIMMDLSDLALRVPDDEKRLRRNRLSRMLSAVCAFALGCGSAALLFLQIGMHVFWIPFALAATLHFLDGE
ncbi:YoaK family protein [Rhizobium sp. SL42]|uniref:YoaK family protein n=1 Tax=Rhizobium sp. SL42 TaxID=2806346 RepID=UPI001F27397A|nr:DUF1275 family protein [Rhizobium sp. SL42]UJW77820.1 DUF1275 family protein [Rhizobium sp. SL42]